MNEQSVIINRSRVAEKYGILNLFFKYFIRYEGGTSGIHINDSYKEDYFFF